MTQFKQKRFDESEIGPKQPEVSHHNPVDGESDDAIVDHQYNIFEAENTQNNTDYDFPQWFWDDDVTNEERSRWMTQDRCRRQVKRQAEAGGMKITMERMKGLEREQRKVEADSGYVDVEEYR